MFWRHQATPQGLCERIQIDISGKEGKEGDSSRPMKLQTQTRVPVEVRQQFQDHLRSCIAQPNTHRFDAWIQVSSSATPLHFLLSFNFMPSALFPLLNPSTPPTLSSTANYANANAQCY